MNTPNKYDLPAEAQQLLNVERQALEPPSGAQARVRARVALTVGALAAGATAAGTAKAASAGASASAATASATAAGAGTSTAAAAAGAGGGLLFKVLAPVGIGAVLLGGVAAPAVKQRLGFGGGNQTVGAPAAQPAAAPVAAEAPAPVVEPQAAQAVVEPASPGPSAVVRSAPVVRRAATPALHEERVGLDEARAALAEGRTSQALKMLEQHARSHPKGQLAEERDALHVMALVKAGRRPAARAAAAQFHARHPNSVMSGAVDAALSSAQ
jgi:hypothetical protein